jgi:WD40 repeat protein
MRFLDTDTKFMKIRFLTLLLMTVMRKESIFSTMHAFVFLFSLFFTFFCKQTNKQTNKKKRPDFEGKSFSQNRGKSIKNHRRRRRRRSSFAPLSYTYKQREKSLRLLLRERRVVVKLNNKMRPILLKGHERPLTFIKYNSDGDLIVTCAKDHHPTLWYSDTGNRVGTYVGHNGAVWTADITRDSKTLATGSADTSCKLWDVGTGTCFQTFQFDQPVRAVSFAIGDEKMLITTDPFMGVNAAIHIVEITKNREEQTSKILKTISGDGIVNGRLNRVAWGALNETFLTAGGGRRFTRVGRGNGEGFTRSSRRAQRETDSTLGVV